MSRCVLPVAIFSSAMIVLCTAGAGKANAEVTFDCSELEKEQNGTLTMSQGLDGWFFRTRADFDEDFYISRETRGYFARMAKALSRQDIALVYAAIPPRGIVEKQYLDTQQARQAAYDPSEAADSYREFVADLSSTDVIAPDLIDLITKVRQDEPFFFKRDHHWTPQGARILATILAQKLTALQDIAGLPQRMFETKAVGEQLMKKTMALEIQRHCRDEIPPEAFQTFETRVMKSEQSSAGEDEQDNSDLFGSPEGAGGVSLVGTSFSENRFFNFDGFLSESLGFEVANHALAGGQLFNAMISYVSSPDFIEDPPSVIIWEAPSYYNPSAEGAAAFRQIIPAILGACDAEEAVAKGKVAVTPGVPIELFEVPAEAGVSGASHYVFIESSSRGFAQFSLKIDYADGDSEWFAVDRRENFRNWGRFFVEFSDDIESEVTGITLEPLSNLETKIDARICRSQAA